ncbi:MAG: 3-isopropylmalate dehydrogenase, partial [Planctomycetes bacterium]|nr:3-isopropylmalate dehydrogenase [Planctomycetota bacterium]
MTTEQQSKADRVTALKASASYRQAHLDPEFMSLEALRPVRLQLEMLKPELTLRAHGVQSTIVVFGGTRVIEKDEAEARVQRAESAAKADPSNENLQRDLRIARNVLAKCHYYDEARELGRIVSSTCQIDAACDYVIVTGGGPGI